MGENSESLLLAMPQRAHKVPIKTRARLGQQKEASQGVIKMTKTSGLLLAICALCSTHSASAAVVDLSVQLDLNAGAITDIQNIGSPETQVWFSDFIAISPVSLAQGDTLRIDIQFTDGQALELISGDWDIQRMWIVPNSEFECAPACAVTTALTDISLIEGQLDLPVTTQIGGVPPLFFGSTIAEVRGPLTDSSLVFNAVTLEASYSSGTMVPVFDEIKVMFQADRVAIRQVPLPAAAGCLMLALACLGSVGVGRPRPS